jgi:xylan 1,4-beta-xylosidase
MIIQRPSDSAIFICFLIIVLALSGISAFAQTSKTRTISASFTDIKGKHDKFYKEVVGAGRASEGLRADWQRDLKIVHDEAGFKYVRFHGLLHDEMGVYNEDKNGKPYYNFQYIDALYDSILDIGMKPFVELGFMPNALKTNDKTIFWWKGNISPPKDYEKWQNLIHELVKHWTERYGKDEVKQWYFEVWNEPNLDFFFTGTQTEYFKLYEYSAAAIKEVSSDYRVGGPATAGRGWITETIDFADKNKVQLDFIATHDYGVEGIGLDENGEQKLFLGTNKNSIIAGVREVRAKINSSAKPNLPLHYTEWSASYSQSDPVHDSYISAPYILSKLKGSEGYIDSMSYWTFTDIFEEGGPVPTPFHGGFGMLNFQGLPKPSFYAYQFLNRLGDEELRSNDAESWTTRSKNAVQVLLWNFEPPQTKEHNKIFFKKDIPAKEVGKVQINIADMPKGNYQLNVYQVGYQVNDVYADFLKLGSPKSLKREQVKQLAKKNDGRPVMTSSIRIQNKQQFTKEIELRENDVFLITLEKK